MKANHINLSLLFGLLMLLSSHISAQKFSQADAVKYFQKNLEKLGLEEMDINEIEVTDNYVNKKTGITHIYLRQQFGGTPIREGRAAVHIKPTGEIFYATNQFIPKLLEKLEDNRALLTKKEAIETAAEHLGIAVKESLRPIRPKHLKPNQTMFSDGGISRRTIPVRQIYEFDENGKLRLSWETEIYQLNKNDWWIIRIDATTGEEVSRENIVLHCTWNNDPKADHSSHQHYASRFAAIPQIRHPFDLPKEQKQEKITETTDASSLSFIGSYNHFPIKIESPIHGDRMQLSGSQIIDNIASPHGWHDTDGDANTIEFTWTQGNNVLAVYDPDNTLVNTPTPDPMPVPFVISGGIINAGNVPDGGSSLIFDYNNNITSPNANGFLQDAVTNLFVWNNIMHDVSFLYGFDEVSGNFQTTNHTGDGLGDDHVFAGAQSGGFVDNASFGTPVDGSNPTMSMYLWSTDAPNVRDGDFDAGVVAHEYGHGISTRMVGGPGQGCLGGEEQGGEGWSDFQGLMTTLLDFNGNGVYEEDVVGEGIRGIGNYVLNQAVEEEGIRLAPYTTDMSINDFTYGDVPDVSAPHGVGFVWCTMLWDLTWALINEYGFEEDIYNSTSLAGNIRATAIVYEAFRYTPCSPNFIEMRDAIFAANQALYPDDAANDESMFWEVFARRGLGVSASEGGNEAFDTPTFHTLKSVNLSEQGKGSDLVYTLTVQNNFTTPLTNVQLSDPLDSRLTFQSSPDGGTFNSGVVSFPPFTVPVGQSVSKSFIATIDPSTNHTESVSLNEIETPTEQAAFVPAGLWQLVSDETHSGNFAYFHPDPEVANVGDLLMNITIPAGANAMAFWQNLDMENGFDGGVFEISTDGGLSYEDLGTRMVKNPYTGIIGENILGVPATILDGRRGFTGTRPYFQTIIDLTGYSGLVTFRWRFASDVLTGQVGWWIDDVEFLNLQHILNEACVNVDQFADTKCADVGTLGTIIRDDAFLATDLLEFKATAEENAIRLDWRTTLELNNKGFELLRRAANEENFTSIAFVDSQGDSNKPVEYQYLDKNVKANIRYFYQLKSLDINNKTDLSNIVTAMISENNTIIQVFPNPATSDVTLNVLGGTLGAIFTIEILDIRGQLIRTLNLENKDNQFLLDFIDLPEQLYLINIKSGNFVTTEQVLIQR